MKTSVTESIIRNLYEGVKGTSDIAFNLAQDVISARAKLKREIAHAISVGLITGKNDKERDAARDTMFAEAYGQLEQLEERAALAKHEAEKARLDLDATRDMLRLYEAHARLQGSE